MGPSLDNGPHFDQSYCYVEGIRVYIIMVRMEFFQSKELPKIGICLPCNKKALKFESELLWTESFLLEPIKIKPEKEAKKK